VECATHRAGFSPAALSRERSARLRSTSHCVARRGDAIEPHAVTCERDHAELFRRIRDLRQMRRTPQSRRQRTDLAVDHLRPVRGLAQFMFGGRVNGFGERD
jgi:hypothetical protein